ncbi:MAG: acyl-CoA dehydrogenase [Acidimicrobiia bacterium]|nr:acyl-CoA dehydrogenase [Acidimicrobiia bacterium]
MVPAEALISERAAAVVAQHPAPTTPERVVLGAIFDAGLAWPHHPVGHGGLGLDPTSQQTVAAALRNAGLPDGAFRLAGATVMAHGTEEQRRRYLRPMWTGEEIWCQLFSELGSGSDLASLATRAVRDGDEWVIDGQKVRTTYGHEADFGMLVARTDPEQPKHRGLSFFVMDMRVPGVEVRPLRQIDGGAEFNEVFLTAARIPAANLLGDVGGGWRAALTTLTTERTFIAGNAQPPRGGGLIARVVDAWRGIECAEPARRDQVARPWIDAEAHRLTMLRADQARRVGAAGPESSLGPRSCATSSASLTTASRWSLAKPVPARSATRRMRRLSA